jgi:hypothetical protein
VREHCTRLVCYHSKRRQILIGGSIDISTIESAVTELYKKIASYYKNKRAQEEDEEDEEMEDAEVESAEKDKSHSTFEIAIVGGRKQDEDEDMT